MYRRQLYATASETRFYSTPIPSKPLLSTVPATGSPRRAGPPVTQAPATVTATTLVAAVASDGALLRPDPPRRVVVTAHPAAATGAAAVDWVRVIAALERLEPHVLAPLPSPLSSPMLPEREQAAHNTGDSRDDDFGDDDGDHGDDDDGHEIKIGSDALVPTTTTTTTTTTATRGHGRYTALAPERRRGMMMMKKRKKKHGRITRLIDVLHDDPKQALKQAQRETIIALCLAAGVIITGAIVVFVFASLPVAEFVLAGVVVVLIMNKELLTMRLNVAKAIASMHPTKEAQQQQQQQQQQRDKADTVQRKLCRAAAAVGMRCREATGAVRQQMEAHLHKTQPKA
jgi:hypothetical protein